MSFITKYFLENIVLKAGDFATGGSFVSKLKEWRRICRFSREKIYELQKEKLKQLLSFASVNSPYYVLQNIPREEDPFTWLRNFPILKKKSFRDNLDYFITEKNRQKLTVITSSGSTGPPSKVFFDKKTLSNNRALQILWWEWAGYQFGNSILQTGVNMNRSREKAIKDILLNTRYISAMSHHESEILEELKKLQETPRDHFVAYASSLYLFAKTALNNQLKGINFKSVISLGEKLMPEFRETIESAFSCPVYDTYGASEGFLIASQCTQGNYHIMSPHVVVELLDDCDQEVKPGEIGRVVLTGLDNYTTPLIRYEVGDMAIKSELKDCSCGMNLPLLGEITGRKTDFIKTPQGKYITVQNVVRVLKHFPAIDQFKLVQNRKGEISIIYVLNKAFTFLDQTEVIRMFEEVFLEPMKISFKKVNELPKAKTGKFQLIERVE
ncbi:MAG: phenylacetate--CoA ligase family protein [Flavobacteriaceae bacterium]|nr:phenylacetate--CoA ligase family protein [Flavobacteriaceae bacterium]